MTVLFGEGVDEIFLGLPTTTQVRAAGRIDLIIAYPKMYPIRQRGLFKGYRFFTVDRYLFAYSVSSVQIRIVGIIPGRMRQA